MRIHLIRLLTGAAILTTPALALASGDAGFEFTIHGFYIIDFFIFAGIIVYFGRKPIAAMLDQRHKNVAEEIQRAQVMADEAEARFNEYRFRLDRLEGELTAVLDEVRKGTKIEVARILADAQTTADRIAGDEQARLQQEAKKIRDGLARHAAEMALDLAEAQVRTRLAKGDKHDQMVERIVAELEARGPQEVQA